MTLLHVVNWVHALQLLNVDFELDAKKVVDYHNKANEVAHTHARKDSILN